MIFYLTFNDPPSGIYTSQVIDVVKCLNSRQDVSVRLIAFLSLRNFILNKRQIKKQIPDALVFPMIPSLKNWRMNTLSLGLVCIRFRPEAIIARGVLAAQLALSVKEKKLAPCVCYDGRGAIAAEWNEYKVVEDKKLKNEIRQLESEVVLNSDHRIAVSEQLVSYWRDEFNFSSDSLSIIPCTLGNNFAGKADSGSESTTLRKTLGFSSSDIILIYSGSTAGWQSFKILNDLIKPHLRTNPAVKILFLAQKDSSISSLINEFPGQVSALWASHDKVPDFLSLGDYGILIREQSVTNRVASPVKFAEYLSCGLNVIISEGLGDYTEFVRSNDCGLVVNNENASNITLKKLSASEKESNILLANKYFNKDSELIRSKFNNLLKALKKE